MINIANESLDMELALFQIGDMLCGLDTRHVQEINHNFKITPVHRAPEYVRGVINLRGEIVTVIDLHQKFSMPPSEDNDGIQVVFVRYENECIGLLVDNIHDVVSANHFDISTPPSNVDGISGAFINGVYRMEKELVIVLDLDELLKK
ncbi:chemotaxis protein CheW [Desulfobacula sp.]|uniref:chemotaxis protein CheW n=1 Tax=Desulfobacula sp. TaxID=2593537 RepID=UPI00260CA541|nr:chemotaxis protein CheW [Desulfobacula sp.]